MMILDLVVGIFTLANSFIALFIVIYAVLFLNKTKSHQDRRPWDYLLVASIIYLLYTVLLMMLKIYDMPEIFGLGISELSIFFQFIYTGLILLSFISQTDLIFKNDVIIIMKKLEVAEKSTVTASVQSEPAQEPAPVQSPAPVVAEPVAASPSPPVEEQPKPKRKRAKRKK